MAFTVTATPGGAQFSRGTDLLVRVLTNATETGGASTGNRNTAAGTPGGSLTPNFSSSFVAFAIAADGASTMSAAAASNTYDFTPGTHTDTWVSAHGHYTGTVTSGTPLTFGAGSTPASADHENWAAYEIPASGGTITVDGSSPAGVFGDILTSATTASFNPPVGSVLVAMVAAGGTGVAGALTCAITDTSGLGLTWTQRVVSSTNDGFQPCFVFTATVPVAPTAALPARARPGRAWLRRFQHPQLALGTPPAPPVFGPAGNQPGGKVAWRRSARALWGGVLAQPGQPLTGGEPQPWPTIRTPRRSSYRAVWAGPPLKGSNAAPGGGTPNGTAPDHLVIARRQAARAYWRGFVSRTTNLLNGTVPDHLVIARRTAARAVWHGNTAAAFPNGTVPDHLVIARRAAARAVVRGFVSSTTNAAPSTPGIGVPPVHLAVARRTAARAFVRGVTVRTTNLVNGNVPGGLVRRRGAARAYWAGTVTRTTNASAAPAVTGTAPDHLVIARRYPARAVQGGIAVPPRYGKPGTGGLVKRRTGTRGQWYARPVRTVNAAPPRAATAPHLVIGRRATARAQARWAPAATTNAPPPPFTVGTLTTVTTTGPGGGNALTATTAPSSGITAGTQRTGGPG